MPEFEDNFYFIGGNLRYDAPSYVERPADKQLLTALQRGQFCYVLTARQMGKSSLMVRTAMRLRRQGVRVAALDLTAIGRNVTAEQWYYGLLGRLGRQLNLKSQLDAFWESYPQFSPVQRWMEAIQEVILPTLALPGRAEGDDPAEDEAPSASAAWTERFAPLVIFIDEIDAVRSLPFSTDEFFAAIRECYNRRADNPDLERLTFCLLGVATPTDLIQDTRTTPFNIGTRIELNDFTETEALPLARGLCWEERTNTALLRRVLYWTGGQPYLTQRLCAALARQSSACVAEVDSLCESLFLTPTARERDSNLLFVRERVLRSEGDLAGLLGVYAQVVRGKPITHDDTNPLHGILRLSGIIRVQEGCLQARNRIYAYVFDRAWIRESMPDAEQRRQRLAFRQGLLRALTVSTVVIAIIGGLAVTNYRSARRADLARDNALEHAREAVAARQRADASAEEALQQGRIARRAQAAAQQLAAQRKIALEALRREKGLADQNARERTQEAAWAEAKTAEARNALYTASMNLAQQAWENNDPGRVEQILDMTQNDPNQGFEWGYWQHLCHPEQQRFTFPSESIKSVRYSADGKRLLILTDANKIRILDIASGKTRLLFQAKYVLTFAELSPDGKYVATCLGEGPCPGVRILAAETGRTLCTHPDNIIYAACFAPDSKTLIIAGGHRIEILDSQTGRPLRTLDLAFGISMMDISQDGKWLVIGASFGPTYLFDVATGKQFQIFDDPHGYPVNTVAISPNNRYIVTGPLATLWDVATGKRARIFSPEGTIRSVCFSPDSNLLATTNADKTLKIWEVLAHRDRALRELRGHSWEVSFVRFSPNGKMLATGSADSTVRLWSVETPEEPRVVSLHGGDINVAEISPNGKWFATGDHFGEITLWDMETGQERRTFFYGKPAPLNPTASVGEPRRYKSLPVRSLCISPDSKLIAAGGDSNLVQVYSTQTGRECLRLHPGSVTHALCFTPDGKQLVTGGRDGLVKLWDLERNERSGFLARGVRDFKGHIGPVFSVCVSPDGKRLLTAGDDKTARLWNLTTGNQVYCLRGYGDVVTCARFSHDSKRILTASWDNTVKVWNAATGHLELYFHGSISGVLSACFSPDDRRILTAGNDQLAKVWDARTGRELLTLRGHGSRVTSACFSPDGRHIVTGSYDQYARIWSSTPLVPAPSSTPRRLAFSEVHPHPLAPLPSSLVPR
jgi:WD40 repeat protein/pyruvate/2-oxoglutarate dehydrogenase complex dihydrolipoamide acyltransferase (E2) component